MNFKNAGMVFGLVLVSTHSCLVCRFPVSVLAWVPKSKRTESFSWRSCQVEGRETRRLPDVPLEVDEV